MAGERFTAFADLKTAYLTFPLYVFMLIDKLFFITSRMNFIDIFNSATLFYLYLLFIVKTFDAGKFFAFEQFERSAAARRNMRHLVRKTE